MSKKTEGAKRLPKFVIRDSESSIKSKDMKSMIELEQDKISEIFSLNSSIYKLLFESEQIQDGEQNSILTQARIDW